MSRTVAEPARAHRRWTSRRGFPLLLVAALSYLSICLAGLPAEAAGGGSPGTATPITSLPFDWTDDMSVAVAVPAATGAEVRAVSSRCNAGRPVYRPAWFRFASATSTSIVARGQVDLVLGRDHFAVRQGVAVLRAGTTEVLDCSVTSGESSTGPVVLAGGSAVLVVQFVAENVVCEPPCQYEGLRRVRVGPGRSYLPNDGWTNATVITSLPYSQTVDTTMASTQAQDGVTTLADCEGTLSYPTALRTAWWSFTPQTSGPLRITANGIPIEDLPPTSPDPSLARLTAEGPVFLDDCGTTFPPVFEAGTTYLIEVGHLLDSYEVNDVSAGGPVTLGVTGGIALRRGPDLVVTDVSWSPSNPVAGSPVRFRATIKNQGAAATQGGVVHGVSFRVDGKPKTFADSWNASLPPGGSVTLVANGGVASDTWAATAGNHTVEARVDDINRLPGEASETNNSRTRLLTVGAAPAKPDLVVTGVSASPANPTTGAGVTFRATIKNQGTAATTAGTHRVLFKVDGIARTWSDTRTAPLAPGASVTLTANAGGTSGRWTATAGPHTLRASVDDPSRIVEQDEANNTKDVQLVVGAAVHRPDLVVTAVTWSPSLASNLQPVRFSATIKNQGKLTTPDVVHGVLFRIDGRAVSFSDNSRVPLRPGESVTLTANGGPTGGTWTATRGTHTLRAHVDDVNRVTGEANEGNNVMDRVLVVR